MMVRVLPLPAPAKTSSGPTPWVTAFRCGSLSSVAIWGPSLTLRPLTHKTRANGRELLYALAMHSRFTRPRPVLAGESVLLPRAAGPLVLPEECACCAGPATHRLGVARQDGASVLVGYCDECAEHQAAGSSRVLAVALASLILAFVSAAGLPLVAPRLGLFVLASSVSALAILPLLALLYQPRSVPPPHAAR